MLLSLLLNIPKFMEVTSETLEAGYGAESALCDSSALVENQQNISNGIVVLNVFISALMVSSNTKYFVLLSSEFETQILTKNQNNTVEPV